MADIVESSVPPARIELAAHGIGIRPFGFPTLLKFYINLNLPDY
jgi:hypothetical protein